MINTIGSGIFNTTTQTRMNRSEKQLAETENKIKTHSDYKDKTNPEGVNPRDLFIVWI